MLWPTEWRNSQVNTPDWYLDEVAHAGSEHLDEDYVAGYDRKSGTDVSVDVDLLLNLGLDEQSILVDFGGGTGQFALAAAPHCAHVTLVDPSAAMLDYARRQADRLSVPNVDFVQAGFLTYQHTGEPADFAYSRNALHHLPDFWKALAIGKVSDVLRPGGIFRLRDLAFAFELSEVEDRIPAWLEGAVEDPVLGWTRAEFETHLQKEYSTFTWLLEQMLERAGFEIGEREYSASGIYTAYVCVKR
jgi:ubiquinone/menaquinone biosynthesis C-methylase UbiE